MAFIKIVKNKSYFARYQVQYRRRREGKTDYARRRRLVVQDKTKYAAHKYRLVVRFTNKDIIAQIIYSKIQGDFVLAAAYAHELTRYGLPVGHTNYSAGYATGLLLARRLLKKIGLDTKYVGNTEVNGEDYHVTPIEDGPRPFKAFLDVGLAHTSTGSRVFSVLKGATDGGLNVPHSVSRFVGYDSEAKKLEAEVLRDHIFGEHVAEYMRELKKEDTASYESHFSRYIAKKIAADSIEDLFTSVHEAIRKNPEAVKSTKTKPAVQQRFNRIKLTRKQRSGAVQTKKALHGINA